MESKYLVKIKATNSNFDWVQKSSIIKESEVEILRKVVATLNRNSNYWPMGELGHAVDVYVYELDDNEIEWFNGICPESYDLEFIQEIILYKIENEETLISKEE